jgi:hypothetical protein
MKADLKDRLLTVCRSGVLKKTTEETLPEPYIPFVPGNWNGGLVLAEAQNHGARSGDYLPWLRGLDSKGRMLRLYMRGEQLGCQPWDDGSLKLAVTCISASGPERWAVCNAVLWSRLNPTGSNNNPSDRMEENSVSLWKEYLKVLKPKLVVTAGKVACTVIDATGYQGNRLELLLPSPVNLRRMSRLFDTGDLLERYPEVAVQVKAHGDLAGGLEGNNKIFFACHAVSKAKRVNASGNMLIQGVKKV